MRRDTPNLFGDIPSNQGNRWHPDGVSRRQRRRRSVLVAVCGACTTAFALFAAAFARGDFAGPDLWVWAWWLSGIGALVFGVGACHIGKDATEDARYLSSILYGLRDEWRRS